jgi:hypothetical protein
MSSKENLKIFSERILAGFKKTSVRDFARLENFICIYPRLSAAPSS